jgi:hypothetical protein
LGLPNKLNVQLNEDIKYINYLEQDEIQSYQDYMVIYLDFCKKNYFFNLSQCIGWYIPFYPSIYPIIELEKKYKIISTRSERTGKTRERLETVNMDEAQSRFQIIANNQPIAFVYEEDNYFIIDFEHFIDKLVRDDLVHISMTERSNGKVLQRGEWTAEELGATWDVPRVYPGGAPPSLNCEVRVADSDGDGLMEPGERLQATLIVRNADKKRAWKISPKWSLPGANGGVELDAAFSEPFHDRLDPGQSWATSATLTAPEDWLQAEPFEVAAVVRDFSGHVRSVSAIIEPKLAPLSPSDLFEGLSNINR